MGHQRLILLFALCAPFVVGHADVYKSTDSKGKTVFSDSPSNGAQKLDIPAPPVKAPVVEEPEKPENPEKAPPKKNVADEKRKDFQDELNVEAEKLDAAKAELIKAQAAISGTERNSQEDIDKTAKLEDEIAEHEKAIEGLRKQISGLK